MPFLSIIRRRKNWKRSSTRNEALSKEFQICTRGVWDTSVPGITFDDQGVSNYCHLMETLMEAYPRGSKGREIWEALVKKIKSASGNKKYDCIIGVSGGTDSSYLLYLAREYGLRPLAVNFDNGWSSDIAVKNIKKMTNALGIDLETYVVNYDEIKDLNVAYMKSQLPWIDMPTDMAIKAVLYKIAAKEKVRFFLRGNDFRSEGSQPREWTYGDGRQLAYIHEKFGKIKLKTFPNYTISNLLYYSAFRKIKSVYPYYYLDYNKKSAQQFLQEKYDWEYYGGHHYENLFTRFVITYWLYEKFGIDKRKITLSAQIISGEISREEALSQLSHKPYTEEEKRIFLDFILKKLDLSQDDFEKLMSMPNKTFLDYPSYYKYVDNLNRFSKPLVKMIFFQKPQSFYQSEFRKKTTKKT